MDLPVAAGYDRVWNPESLVAQLALQYSTLNHCATREACVDNVKVLSDVDAKEL
jgi:hypothetical protein